MAISLSVVVNLLPLNCIITLTVRYVNLFSKENWIWSSRDADLCNVRASSWDCVGLAMLADVFPETYFKNLLIFKLNFFFILEVS